MKGNLAAWIPYLAVIIGLHRLENAWWAMAIYHGLALGYLFSSGRIRSWRLLVGGWSLWPGILLSGAAALSGLALYLLYPAAALPGPDLTERLAGIRVPHDRWLVFCIYYVAVTPWLEELFWRGEGVGRSRLPDRSDIMFAGYHVLVLVKFITLPWAGAAFLTLIAGAYLWRWIRLRTGGLVVPLLSHLAADGGIIAAVDRFIS